jgi:predicted O-methyltransferase YrrM
MVALTQRQKLRDVLTASTILALVEERLRPGAVIVADNADYCPDYLEHVSSAANGYFTMSFTDDVELSIRL